ncbi:MAG: hypothetical protein HN657_07815 [Candidatus Marinimicrobia bacterium]|jgi:predicted acyltransferase|nr:hypothetical protein [Candidatus Neomarinimicrobiota bacterium]MBT3496961.1 hypothetical protein [Candidatus Neomarinimicrobiota bacterium]MBT3693034.1 hypothetical protein [Candidatus Neomarinimicrobiota bacterium]MBT3732760.1 hypothetical protein [Candidatus Neomarinimicrobiota bacterium]MBT4144971.1 hypothetical protein [Candidatus Neomarinimicrobiota bacterium]
MTKPRRIYSIDVFRGMTIALMILVNNPGSWSHVYAPLLHAKWHGCTLTDLVFPFFLFIVGASMRFAFVRWHHYGSKEFYIHVFWRTFSIFMAGLLLNAFPFIRQNWDWTTFRIMGVLQRIALAYGLASIIAIRFDFKQIIQIISGILLAYWALLWFGSSGNPYEVESNFVRIFDMWILGENHLWSGFGLQFDPEGLLSTFPSVGTVLLGYLAGGMIQTSKQYSDCAKRMAIFGFGLTIIGFIWGFIFPINKALWTSSYVLFTGGIALLVLSALTWIIDGKQWKKPFWIFEVFGTNSLFIFVGSGLWAKTILKIKFTLEENTISGYGYLYQTIFQPFAGDLNGSLLFALSHVLGWWFILYWLYRKKIFIKL